MVISLAFTALTFYLGLKLLRYERNRGTLKRGEDYQVVYFFAILVGLWSAFVFAMPGVDAVYRYSNQGRVDYLQSEIPAENPPIVPWWTYFVVGWDLLMRILHLAGNPYFRPLPTVGQNIMFGLLWVLPFLICTAFSFYWLLWTIGQQKLGTTRGVAQLG